MKHFVYTLLLLTCSFTLVGQEPQFQWAFGYGQTVTRKLTHDINNNIYGVGYIIGTPDMDPGVGTSIASSNGQQDIFISKFDPQGNLIWYKTLGGADSEGAVDIVIDSQGNLVMTGYFNLTVDFDPSVNSYPLTSAGSNDVFILKLNSDGDFISAASFGGTGSDESFALQIDTNDDIVITGYFSNTADFDPSGTSSTITASGKDIFISKYNSSNGLIWARSFANSTATFAGYYNKGYDIVIDDESNIHVVGEFAGTVDFDPSPSTFNLVSSPTAPINSPDINIFYVKLSNSGDFIIAEKLLGLNPVIEKDANNDLLLGGNFYSSNVDFDFGTGIQNLTINGSVEYFLLKIDKYAVFQWVKDIGGNGNGIRPSIGVGSSNTVLFTSNFSGTRDFDPSGSLFNLTSTGLSNAFITKLASDGSFIWAINYGSTSGSGITDVNSIIVDNQLGIISTGSYGTSSDMDPGIGSFTLLGGGNYYQKLSECQPTSSSIDTTSCVTYTAPDGAVYTSPGTYTAVITNNSGCDSTITINLSIAPAVDNTTSLNGLTISSNESSANYQWIDCSNNGEIAGQNNATYDVISDGHYAVIVSNEACVDTSDCVYVFGVGIDDLIQEKYTIAPNPSNGKFTVFGFENGQIIRVTDQFGRVIFEAEMINSEVNIDLSEQENGIYYCSVNGEVHRVVFIK